MKKKILSFVLMLCLMIPFSFMFAGCKDDDKTITLHVKHVNALFEDYDITLNEDEDLKDKLKTFEGYSFPNTTDYFYVDNNGVGWKDVNGFGTVRGNLQDGQNIYPNYIANDCSAKLAINGYIAEYNLPRGIDIETALASKGLIITDYNSCGWYDLSDKSLVPAFGNEWHFVKPATNTLIPSTGYLELETYLTDTNGITFEKNSDGVTCTAFIGTSTGWFDNYIIPKKYIFEDENIAREISIVEIKNNYFRLYGWLKNSGKIVVPSTTKEITSNGYVEADNCNFINLPEGLETFSANIYDCDITSIRIPSTLTQFTGTILGYRILSDHVYTGYKSCLSTIVVDNNNPIYKSNNIMGFYSHGNTSVTYVKSSDNVIIEKTTNKIIYGCNGSKISEGVVEIGANAFEYCSFTEAIELPSSLIKIGEKAFYKCNGIQKLRLKENVEYIDQNAFEGSDLKYIYIPNSVTTIKLGAFYGLDYNSAILFLEAESASAAFDEKWNYSDSDHALAVRYNMSYADFVLQSSANQ